MMKTTRFCNLSFYSVHPISEDMGETGVMDFRIQHRWQEIEGTTGRVTEDVVSPVVSRVFAVPVTTFHVPELCECYVSEVLARLDLGSDILRDVSPRIFSFVEEVLGRSEGDGFWLGVELDVWTRNESGYGDEGKDEDVGWRAVDEGLDRGEDGGGDGDEDEDEDSNDGNEDGEEEGSRHEDEYGEDGEGCGGEDSESKHEDVDGEDSGIEVEDGEDSGGEDEDEDKDKDEGGEDKDKDEGGEDSGSNDKDGDGSRGQDDEEEEEDNGSEAEKEDGDKEDGGDEYEDCEDNGSKAECEDDDGEDRRGGEDEDDDGEENGNKLAEDEDGEDSGSEDEAENSDGKNKLDIVNEGMSIMQALAKMGIE